MKPFAVIGASSGTGLALVKLLEKNRLPARAIRATHLRRVNLLNPLLLM